MRVFVETFQHKGILTNALIVELFLNLQQQDCSTIYLENLLQRIIESAISNFDLPQYASYIKTRPSRAFAGSLQNSCNPRGPIKAFYEYASAHEEGTPSRLLQKIQTQVSGLAVEQLKEFLMSFLEEIITVVDVSSVEVQRCIQTLVTNYITRMVGKEPKKPSDWARPEEVGSKCYQKCDDCSKMNTFLRDSELQRHVSSCKDTWETFHLETNYHSFKYFEVEKVDRNPIAVVKTLKWWEEQHRKWESRASDALEALRNLPRAELKQCLAHRYDEIMDLRVVKVIDDSNEGDDQGCYKTRSIAPQKRPRDDL